MPELNFTMLVIFSFPEAMVLAGLSLSLLGIRSGFRQILWIGCLQTLCDAFLFLVVGKLISIPFGVHTIVQTTTLVGIIGHVMQISYRSSCLAVVFGFTVYISIESLMVPFITLITGHLIPIINEDNWLMRIPTYSLQLMINVLIIFLIRRFNVWLTEGWSSEINFSFLRLSGFLFTQSILILYIGYQYYSAMQENSAHVWNMKLYYIIMGNGVLPIITIIIIRQVIILIRRESENKAQLDTFRHVEELLNTMRAQRHDFTHELQVIYGLLEVEEYQEARTYLRKSVSEVATTSELVKTDNLGVTALLYTKTGLAEARKIDLHITVETSLQQCSLAARDISLVLGNLIDNALEAVDELPGPERKVEVIIGQDLEGYVLEVKNYGPPIPVDLVAKIFAPGFSTKGEGRGMGLYSIQKLVHKYNGDLQVTSSSTGTCFRVLIPIDQSAKAQPVRINKFKGRWGKWLG